MKKAFLTGLVALLPISVTIFLVSFVLHIFTYPFIEFVSSFLIRFKAKMPFLASEAFIHFIAQIIIIILFCTFIALLGFVARWFFFKVFFKLGKRAAFKNSNF